MGADHLRSPFWSSLQRASAPEVAVAARTNDHKRAMNRRAP
jgi:hypothetical protein